MAHQSSGSGAVSGNERSRRVPEGSTPVTRSAGRVPAAVQRRCRHGSPEAATYPRRPKDSGINLDRAHDCCGASMGTGFVADLESRAAAGRSTGSRESLSAASAGRNLIGGGPDAGEAPQCCSIPGLPFREHRRVPTHQSSWSGGEGLSVAARLPPTYLDRIFIVRRRTEGCREKSPRTPFLRRSPPYTGTGSRRNGLMSE